MSGNNFKPSLGFDPNEDNKEVQKQGLSADWVNPSGEGFRNAEKSNTGAQHKTAADVRRALEERMNPTLLGGGRLEKDDEAAAA